MKAVNDAIRKRFLQCIEQVRTENKQMRTNTELAKKLRVSSPRITEWENGTRMPTVEQIFYLCKEFNQSADFIISGKLQVEKSGMHNELQDLVKRISNLERAHGKARKSA